MIATGDAAGPSSSSTRRSPRTAIPALLALASSALELATRRAPSGSATSRRCPEAFSDHAARFYLDVGKTRARALELARANLANRDTPEARALVVEAALAGRGSRRRLCGGRAAGDGRHRARAAVRRVASAVARAAARPTPTDSRASWASTAANPAADARRLRGIVRRGHAAAVSASRDVPREHARRAAGAGALRRRTSRG